MEIPRAIESVAGHLLDVLVPQKGHCSAFWCRRLLDAISSTQILGSWTTLRIGS